MSSIIGRPVRKIWGSMVRYGVVKAARIAEDSWTYLDINWIDDQKFETAQKTLLEQRPAETLTSSEYRIDSVQFFDVEETMRALNLLANRCDPPTSFLDAMRKVTSGKSWL